ncbi:MAG: antitoxin family protein [Dehalococcoidia bacterium]
MTRTITVIFDGESFRPTEPVDLPANTEYQMTIESLDSAGTEHPVDSELRPLASLLDITIDTGLGDLAEQHDHYLYGTPKR